MHGAKYNDLDQKLPDPILEELARINKRLAVLEDQLGVESCRYSISNQVINDDDKDKPKGQNNA